MIIVIEFCAIFAAVATPCLTDEDLSGQLHRPPCHYDAEARGNGEGVSFIDLGGER